MGEGVESGFPEKGSQQYKGKPREGGYRAAMFVFALTALENVGFIGIMVSLVLYFIYVLHFQFADASTTTTNFTGSTFLLSLLGGFISDSYITRLNTVLLFGVVEIAGWIVLTVQAHSPGLRPDYYNLDDHIHGRSKHVLYLALCLLAVGAGSVRGSLPALGADQFNRHHPAERKQLASFFNWLLLSVTVGASIGVTVVVWVSIERSWAGGLFISTLLAAMGFVAAAAGKPFYRVRIPGDSPLLRIIQVPVAAIRNWKLPPPRSSDELYEKEELTEEKIAHTDQFRFLDRAAILPPGTPARPWRVCSVTQVEECKILTRMLPILLSTILMNTCLAQLQTFSVLQGQMMNRRLGRHFEVPAPSIPIIPLLFMAFLIPLYEVAFVPFARRLTGHPSGITHLQRVGVGLVLSAISMTVAGLVEVKRRDAFSGELRLISVFWLSFQYGIFGIADMFTLVGLMEFFYSEAPAGMRSLSTSFSLLSLSLGYFLSSILVNIINSVTSRRSASGLGWLHGLDLNSSRLERFYWFLAVLSCANFANYLFWASWYKYKEDAPGCTGDANGGGHMVESNTVEGPPATTEEEVKNGEASQVAAVGESSTVLEKQELIR